MDRIAVLFPALGADLADARGDWKSEYEACAGCDLFMPVLYDEDGFAGGSDLKVSRPAPSKKTYCIRRDRGALRVGGRLHHGPGGPHGHPA
jgi:hypothetical protein